MDLSSLTLGEIAGVLGGLAVLWVVGSKVVRVFGWLRRGVHLVDDLLGEPARDGTEARPGLMQRVTNGETASLETTAAVEELAVRVAAIDHELRPNSGESLRDAVDRLERDQRVILLALPRRWRRVLDAQHQTPRKDTPT